jgi:hypothetical protein
MIHSDSAHSPLESPAVAKETEMEQLQLFTFGILRAND